MVLLSYIDPDMVMERHYFLEKLNDPAVIGGIRITAVLLLLFFAVSYLRYRKK